jgi:hypothetical protein
MLPGINQCMISWGRVQEVDEETQEVVVKLKSVGLHQKKTYIGNCRITAKL